jgi:hypothetical protein
VSCDVSLVVPYKSVFSTPIILTDEDDTAITFNGTLLFMVKKNETDLDVDAIIKKSLTIIHTNGDPYHALLSFDLVDTSHARGKYWFGFKTGESGEWLPSETDTLEINGGLVQGQTI